MSLPPSRSTALETTSSISLGRTLLQKIKQPKVLQRRRCVQACRHREIDKRESFFSLAPFFFMRWKRRHEFVIAKATTKRLQLSFVWNASASSWRIVNDKVSSRWFWCNCNEWKLCYVEKPSNFNANVGTNHCDCFTFARNQNKIARHIMDNDNLRALMLQSAFIPHI